MERIVVSKFCDHIIGEAHRLYKSFPEVLMNPLNPEEIEGYKKSKKCHICFGPFMGKNPKVHDHCHYSG